jgi:hypothetical protein
MVISYYAFLKAILSETHYRDIVLKKNPVHLNFRLQVNEIFNFFSARKFN